jgi:hypothetical protein
MTQRPKPEQFGERGQMYRSNLPRRSAYALIALCFAHIVMFFADFMNQAPSWADGILWSTRHIAPFRTQPETLLHAGAAFWATIGSSAIPLLVLAFLILDMDRRRLRIPTFVPVSLLLWSLVGSAILEPSGFPLIAAAAAGLLVGIRRTAHENPERESLGRRGTKNDRSK